MDPKVKNEWLEALRSGDYEQTRNILGRVDESGASYCCLGVLCKVYQDTHPGEITSRTTKYGHEIFEYGGIQEDSALPDALADRLNIKPHEQESLVNMNDTQHKSFPEIADWIEVNL